jgi:hypothetical protein
MTFDARSKERLEALGRTLPKTLPVPKPAAAPRGTGEAAAAGSLPAEGARHPLEREQDPAALFRELIAASPDGSVPPHLLDRLRQLETPSRPSSPVAATPSPTPGASAGPRQGSGAPVSRGGRRAPRNSGKAPVSNDDQDLYTAFAQLLLEDDET